MKDTFQKFQRHLFNERKAMAAPVTTELSRAEMARDQLEVDNARLAEIGNMLDQSSRPIDEQWPVAWKEKASLEAERSEILSTHKWYSEAREALFKLAGGRTWSRFSMRADGTQPADDQRIRVLEERLGLESPAEVSSVGTAELWSTVTNRHYDLPGRIQYFARLLLEFELVTKEALEGVELRPPTAVRAEAIRYAEQAERETAEVIRAEILRAVAEHAAKNSLGDPSISEDIIRRTASAQATRDALALYNRDIGKSGQGLTVDYLKSWAKKCASKGLLPKHISLPGLGDLWVATR